MSQPIRVVIVDDIPETREHLTKLLGFETDIEVAGAAGSGLDALDLAVKLRPDVVLMDINMPGMDGIATTEQLSASLPSTAIVMMSVQGEADYLRRSMLAGAREFLVKPFSSEWSRRRTPRRTATTATPTAPAPRSASPARSSPCSRPRAESGGRRSP